ncbi:hypothetical protein KAR91_82915 [Candidatus Pacearchaeota archaeon]|nr:hypothetical protein [Candidatus Pacearchaeota archaeon]
MKVTLTGDGELQADLTKFERKLLTREIMGQMAGEANTLIVDRTLKGIDKEGNPFANYSESYERIKAKRGGKFFAGKANLHDKGHMLGNMTFKATEDTAFLYFTKPEEQSKALGHIKGVQKRGLPIRDFFGLTKVEEKEVLSIPEDRLKNSVKEFNR